MPLQNHWQNSAVQKGEQQHELEHMMNTLTKSYLQIGAKKRYPINQYDINIWICSKQTMLSSYKKQPICRNMNIRWPLDIKVDE